MPTVNLDNFVHPGHNYAYPTDRVLRNTIRRTEPVLAELHVQL